MLNMVNTNLEPKSTIMAATVGKGSRSCEAREKKGKGFCGEAGLVDAFQKYCLLAFSLTSVCSV